MIDLKDKEFLHQCMESFYFGYREFTAQPDRILAEQGLNRIHHRILYFIARNPGLAVNDLLDILQVSKQALHAPLKQLLAMELVTSSPSKADRRVRQLKLSKTGKTLEKQLSNVQMKKLVDAMQSCDAEAAEHWLNVMKALK